MAQRPHRKSHHDSQTQSSSFIYQPLSSMLTEALPPSEPNQSRRPKIKSKKRKTKELKAGGGTTRRQVRISSTPEDLKWLDQEQWLPPTGTQSWSPYASPSSSPPSSPKASTRPKSKKRGKKLQKVAAPSLSRMEEVTENGTTSHRRIKHPRERRLSESSSSSVDDRWLPESFFRSRSSFGGSFAKKYIL